MVETSWSVGLCGVKRVRTSWSDSVVGLRGELSGEGVDLLDDGQYALQLAVVADALLVRAKRLRELLVGESLLLGEQQLLGRQSAESLALKMLAQHVDGVQLAEEPWVDFRQLADAVDAIASLESGSECVDAPVGSVAQLVVEHIVILERRAWLEAFHAGCRHPNRLLHRLLEVAPDGHDLSHRLHRRAQAGGDSLELVEVPAGKLDHYIVE
eukprot:scaffold3795_cov126-Isochrysis_galbana.AAC.15